MTSILTPDTILDLFSRFLNRVTENKPYADHFTDQFHQFAKNYTEDDPYYNKTYTFLRHMKNKPIPESELPKHDISKDSELKTFQPRRLVSGLSIIKFNQILFRDYVIKNSILLPDESKLLYRFSHIKEFLPDSQNFYRVIGIGLLESYLTNTQYKDRLRKVFDAVYNSEVTLSTKFYPYSSNELRVTFCGFLNQLSKLIDEAPPAKKVRDLLYEMCNRDSMFDMALISYMKELIIAKTKGRGPDLASGKPQNEYAIITELLPAIPEAVGLNLIVEVVQDGKVKELIYPSRNPRDNPNLNIINERQLTYENYHLLSFEEQEDEIEIAGLAKANSYKSTSNTYSTQSTKNLMVNKLITDPDQEKRRSPKERPLSIHNLSSDEIKPHKLNEGTLSSKNAVSKPLLTTTQNEIIPPSYRTPISSTNSVYEKKITTETTEFKLPSDRKSQDVVMTPSRTRINVASVDLYNTSSNSSYSITTTTIENPIKSDRKIFQTSPNSRVNLSINTETGLSTPTSKASKPSHGITQYGLNQARTPRGDENYYSSPSHSRDKRSPNLHKVDTNQIPKVTVDIPKAKSFKPIDKEIEELKKKLPQAKIQTMIPMSMDTLPSNPFSAFPITNGFSSSTEKFQINSNMLIDYRTSAPTSEEYLERRTIGSDSDKIYNTMHYGGSGNTSFRRNNNTYSNQSGSSTKIVSYDTKTRKIV